MVTDNNDRDKRGRVKVRYHWQEDKTSWVRLATPYGGGKRGMQLRSVERVPHADDDGAEAERRGDCGNRLGAVCRAVGDQRVEARPQQGKVRANAGGVGLSRPPVDHLERCGLICDEAAMGHRRPQTGQRRRR